jgi:hypothetical protein
MRKSATADLDHLLRSYRRMRFLRRRPVVLAADSDAGIAAVLVWYHPGTLADILLEYHEGRWKKIGGGLEEGQNLADLRRSQTQPEGTNPSAIMSVSQSSATRRLAGRLTGNPDVIGWAVSYHVRVGAEVAFLTVGTRRITVPAHGNVIIASAASPGRTLRPGHRPAIRAYRADGTLLTELGPSDFVDSATLDAAR